MSRIFERSDQLKDMVHEVKLRIPEWKVLFAVDGEKDSGKIAAFLDMPESDVSTTLEKLQNMQFVSPREMASEQEHEQERKQKEQDTLELEEESREEGSVEEETAEEDIAAAAAAEAAQEEEDEEDMEEETFQFADEPEDTPAEEPAVSQTEDIEDFGDFLDESAEIEESESSEDDLDELIGNLLEEEPSDATEAAEDEETEEPLEFPEKSKKTEKGEEEEFDLGSIFQEEMTGPEESYEDVIDTLEEDKEDSGTEVAEAPPAAEKEETGEAARQILVVDDSVVIRKMVEIALENENFKIVSVATGKEALTYLDENTPDLIILDIMLSDVNGLDVLKAIKASKDIPVVMLSAKDTPRETSKAKQLGADDFIPKPFKDEELVGKVKELTRK